MKKETFIKTMNDWKSFQNDVEGVHDAMKVLDPDFGGFFLGRVSTLIGKIFEEAVNDKYDYIGYYIYELEWGKKWKKGAITTKEGKDIKLKTLEDLWVALHPTIKTRVI